MPYDDFIKAFYLKGVSKETVVPVRLQAERPVKKPFIVTDLFGNGLSARQLQ